MTAYGWPRLAFVGECFVPKGWFKSCQILSHAIRVGQRADERASHATLAPARACSGVRAGTIRRVVPADTWPQRPSAAFESTPTRERGETNPGFHFVTAYRTPHLSDMATRYYQCWITARTPPRVGPARVPRSRSATRDANNKDQRQQNDCRPQISHDAHSYNQISTQVLNSH
jgi:hypothetical protein